MPQLCPGSAPTPAASEAPLTLHKELGPHSRSPVPRPGAVSMGMQRTLRWVYNGSTQRGTPFSSFPKGAVWAR